MSDPTCPDADDPLEFTPVPTLRERHDGWTPERHYRFIAVLAERGGVSMAARAVGMTAQTANRLRRAGADGFARACDAAIEEGSQPAMASRPRATTGVEGGETWVWPEPLEPSTVSILSPRPASTFPRIISLGRRHLPLAPSPAHA